MCGICAYIGNRPAFPILLNGLESLEERGYDSAGIATMGSDIHLQKHAGKVSEISWQESIGTGGIAHTRWATHGKVTDLNAHPHVSCDDLVAVVHNGIIENYRELKQELIERGHTFNSETDTEVLAHMIEENIRNNLEGHPTLEYAVRNALRRVNGSYAISVISPVEPKKIVVAKNRSPLILGIGDGEMFAGSEVAAFIRYTNRVIYMHDGEFAVLEDGNYGLYDIESGERIEREFSTVDWTPDMIHKAGFPSYMLKEINEQPAAFRKTLSGNSEVDLNDVVDKMLSYERVVGIGAGTSYHALLYMKSFVERYLGIPMDVKISSEARKDPSINERTMLIAVSQGGETADTNHSVKDALYNGAYAVGITNVKGSSLTQLAGKTLYTDAGPERGVAASKTFISQLALVSQLVIQIAKRLGKEDADVLEYELGSLPHRIQDVLHQDGNIQRIGEYIANEKRPTYYIARGLGYPIALEGALKLKELSYIHSEGYPGGELKHGPLALVENGTPIIALLIQDMFYEKMIGNLEEIKLRGGKIIALSYIGDEKIPNLADDVIYLPKTKPYFSPILGVIPMQLIAYHAANYLGNDVDQPRNLAKKVTVE